MRDGVMTANDPIYPDRPTATMKNDNATANPKANSGSVQRFDTPIKALIGLC